MTSYLLRFIMGYLRFCEFIFHTAGPFKRTNEGKQCMILICIWQLPIVIFT